jgi:hypothetical protein
MFRRSLRFILFVRRNSGRSEYYFGQGKVFHRILGNNQMAQV